MNDDFRNLLHTDSSCPFCGHEPEDAILSGLNCSICQPCYEAITYWSPVYAKLFTDDGVFELWEYVPVAEPWRESECENAVFLDPQPTVADLSEQTRNTITAFTENRHQEVLERAPVEDVDMETLTKRVPRPIIVTVNWVYAQGVEAATYQDNDDKQAQATLTEAV